MSQPDVTTKPAQTATFRRESDGMVGVQLTDDQGQTVVARISGSQFAQVASQVLGATVIPAAMLPAVEPDEFGWLVTEHGELVTRAWAHPSELRRHALSQMSALAWIEGQHSENAA